MALNCEQGDLALVIAGRSAGKVVSCLEVLPAGSEYVDEAAGALWRVDRPLEYLNEAIGMTATKYLAPDKVLMPIRPDAWDSDSAEDVCGAVDSSGSGQINIQIKF